MQTVHARIQGRVQGVFFRDFTRKEAQRLGLTGWVRNMPDGSVEAMLQGDEGKISQMKTWLSQGSPQAEVSDVSLRPIGDADLYNSFQIKY